MFQVPNRELTKLVIKDMETQHKPMEGFGAFANTSVCNKDTVLWDSGTTVRRSLGIHIE